MQISKCNNIAMSSSSMPSAKRRRVDAANETLKKPFRSPMVKRPQPLAGSGTTESSPSTPAPAHKRDSNDVGRVSTPSKLSPRHFATPRLHTNPNDTPSKPVLKPGPRQPLVLHSGSKPDGLTVEDADLLDQLSWRRTEAELKIREVEKEMELVRQAARIESGKKTTNEEMAKLVRRWKGACRIAAEELFELIRGRVDSMGGGAAWRETRQQTGWFDDEAEEERKRRKENGEESDDREELEGLEEVEESEDGPELSEERVSSSLWTADITSGQGSCLLTSSRTSRCI